MPIFSANKLPKATDHPLRFPKNQEKKEEAAPKKEAPVSTPVTTKTAPPPSATGQERAVRPVRAARVEAIKVNGDMDGNAFVRNHRDMKPFVRGFFKQAGRFPTTDETLGWLREHGRYSGEWEDNEAKRARRVGQILRFTERTFDPSKLSNGEHQTVELHVNRFRWWVRRHFGPGIAVEKPDYSRFDPFTMTAPVTHSFVPAEFIQTFLAVVEFCVRHDPLGNKAMPTNRIKKLWAMVEGGANWNQRYYQVVRDRLNKMGVISITDREHEPGKAWRWESGEDFPEGTWKEEQRKLRGRVKHLAGDGIELNRERKVHNTLYQDVPDFGPIEVPIPLVRPPPWADWLSNRTNSWRKSVHFTNDQGDGLPGSKEMALTVCISFLKTPLDADQESRKKEAGAKAFWQPT